MSPEIVDLLPEYKRGTNCSLAVLPDQATMKAQGEDWSPVNEHEISVGKQRLCSSASIHVLYVPILGLKNV